MSDAVLWQWGGQQDNHALLRSARVPLPPVFGSGSACVSGAEQIAAPAGATAEVLRSHMVKPSCVPPSVFDELQEDAAKLLRHLLVEHPEEMPIISMMGNWPRPQVPPPPRPCPSPTLLALALPSWPWRSPASPASPPDPSPLSSRLVPLLSLSPRPHQHTWACWSHPQIEFNTKLSWQHSRQHPDAAAAPQRLHRLCPGCWDGCLPRGAHCDHGGAACTGCNSCVGRQFCCPACCRIFESRWMYETGSGVGSVGRDPGHWEVRPFTRAQEAAAQLLDMMTPQAHQPLQPPLRSCVVVGYLGASFCAACALGKPHGSKQCGSVLHHHRDNGAGANSQQSTPNHTLSVGAARPLDMQLRLPHSSGGICGAGIGGGGGHTYSTFSTGAGHGAGRDFTLEHGTHFYLDPRDEMHLPRAVGDGSVAYGSYFHGMTTEVQEDSISMGCVFRCVASSAEVDVGTNHVILHQAAQRAFVTRRMHKGLNNQPPWAHGFKGTRAQAVWLARQHWQQSEARPYAAAMSGKLVTALADWTCSLDGASRLDECKEMPPPPATAPPAAAATAAAATAAATTAATATASSPALSLPRRFSSEAELAEILKSIPFGSVVRMGDKMHKIESCNVSVGDGEHDAYFEKRTSSVTRNGPGGGRGVEENIFRAAWEPMQDCEEMDMLIYGEDRMAATVCSLLEYDGFQAKMPGLISKVVSYGEESLFNAGLVEHASNSVYTNGSFTISFMPDHGVGEATARPT